MGFMRSIGYGLVLISAGTVVMLALNLICTGYAKLRVGLNRVVVWSKRYKLLELRRTVIFIVLAMVAGLFVYDFNRYGKADLFGMFSHVLLVGIIVFWVYSAEHFTKRLKVQKDYFGGLRYRCIYNGYYRWMGMEKIPLQMKLYYAAWILVSGWLYITSIQLKIYRFDSLLHALNSILTAVAILLSGNSVFSTIVFTYFLCDLCKSEEDGYRARCNHCQDRAHCKRLPYNQLRPAQTYGLTGLLHDTQAHSASFLGYALAYAVSSMLNIYVAFVGAEQSFSWEVIGNALQDDNLQLILAMMGLLCGGMYIITTIGSRFFLRRLLALWKQHEIKTYEREIAGLCYCVHSRDRAEATIANERFDALEKEKISQFPSMLELLLTALLGGLVTAIFDSIF